MYFYRVGMSSCSSATGIATFGGARLPKVPMVLTKAPTRLVPTSGYADTLAEPRYLVWIDEAGCSPMVATSSRGNQPAGNTQTPARRAHRPNKIRSVRERSIFAVTFRSCGSLAPPKRVPRHLTPRTLTVRVPTQLAEQPRSHGRFEPRTDPCHKSDIFPARLEV
jgi:hypothetical protein